MKIWSYTVYESMNGVYVHIFILVSLGPADESETFTHELRGVIPRSFEYLFSLINREKIRVCKC